MPTTASTTPPAVAPTMTVSCIATIESDIASGICARGTSVGMIACRVGNSKDDTVAEASTAA